MVTFQAVDLWNWGGWGWDEGRQEGGGWWRLSEMLHLLYRGKNCVERKHHDKALCKKGRASKEHAP